MRSRAIALAIVVLLAGNAFALARGGPTRAVAAPVETTTTTSTVVPESTTTTSTTTTTVTTLPPTTVAPRPPKVTTPVEPVERRDRCADGLAEVEASGLFIPAQFAWYCPGPAIDERGHYRVGLASWGDNLECPPGNHTPGVGCFIDVDEPHIKSDAYLLNTIAHELCHADEIVTDGSSTESEALACATAHGF